MRNALVILGLLASGVGGASAQTSASYAVESAVLNQGGRPTAGQSSQSTSYRVSSDSIGEDVVGVLMSSASYQLESGFLPAYGPATEVLGLRLATLDRLEWDAAPHAIEYGVYRDAIASLSGGAYGTCAANDVSATTWTDPAVPAAGAGFFYLVTASNRLGDEGPLGSGSDGATRPNTSPCP